MHQASWLRLGTFVVVVLAAGCGGDEGSDVDAAGEAGPDGAQGACAAGPPLLTPEEGAVMDNGCMNQADQEIWDFSWAYCPGATRYHLYVKASTAELPTIDDNTLTAASFHRAEVGYILNGSRLGWTWRVRAEIGGGWGPWTAERTFDVEPIDTDCP